MKILYILILVILSLQISIFMKVYDLEMKNPKLKLVSNYEKCSLLTGVWMPKGSKCRYELKENP